MRPSNLSEKQWSHAVLPGNEHDTCREQQKKEYCKQDRQQPIFFSHSEVFPTGTNPAHIFSPLESARPQQRKQHPLQLFHKNSFNWCSAIALLRGLCFLCQKRGQRTSNPCKTRVQRGTGSHAAFKSLFHPFRVVSCSGSFPPSARRFPDRARQGTPGHAFRQPIPGGSIS